MSQRLAIIWTNFGPYHMARIRAMHPYFDVKAIELASDQRLYRWENDQREQITHTVALGEWEDQSRLKVALRLWRVLDTLRPSILLIPGYYNFPVICAALWGRTHAATNILMSESNADDHQRKEIREGIKRLLIRLLFSGGIVGGKRAASYLRELGIKEHKIALRYDVVDNDFYATQAAKCRAETNAPIQSPYFLYVGRLAPEKNLPTLLKAHEEYLKSGGTWPLILVGDGPLKAHLQSQAVSQVQSGAVVFPGHKNVHELPRFYAFAGCFVLPSTREPWGLVVNEAMASSLPVIVSSRCGCADDLVENGSNGFLIDPLDVSAIAESLMRMSGLNAEERAIMGRKSLDIITHYSPEQWASEVHRITSVLKGDTIKNGL